MLKRTNLILTVVLLVLTSGISHASAQGGQLLVRGLRPSFVSQALTTNDREQDGLAGPVRRVKTETAKISTKNGKPVEGPRVVLETATYDIKGAKVDNAYFLAAGGALTGKEVYKYDAKGNIVEMTLHNEDGTLLTKEVYTYELDAMGNWTKMITSVAVLEGGKMSFEPTEVTYRSVSYFLDEAMMAKMAQPPASQDKTPAVSNNTAAPNAVVSTPAVASSASSSNASLPSSVKTGGAVSPAPAVAEKVDNKTAAAAPPVAKNNSAPKSEQKLAAAPPAVAAFDKASVAAPSSLSTDANSSSAPVVKVDGEAPARPVARGPIKPVSGGILNGKAVSLPAPAYPDIARRQRAVGVVTVEVIVDLTGKVISAKATDGPMLLQAAAERAALQARFSPTLLSGQPVKVAGQINYNFTLQ